MAVGIKMEHPEDEKIVSNFKVSKSISKVLVKEDGTEKIYFIDRDYGLAKGWFPKMNFKNEHPLDPNMVEVDIVLERS